MAKKHEPTDTITAAAEPVAIDPERIHVLAELWQCTPAEAEARERERLAKKPKAAIIAAPVADDAPMDPIQ